MQNFLLETLLAVLTALLGWDSLRQRKRYNLLCQQTATDNKLKEFALAQKYVDEFTTNIVNPLQIKLDLLTHAINATKTCPHYPDCPVDAELRHCPQALPVEQPEQPEQQHCPDRQPSQ